MTVVAADFPNDPELVAAWRGGDQRAATVLVQRHAPSLGRYLAAAGATAVDLEDLVQDTFVRAFRGLDSWRGEGSFRGWLFRIGSNLLKDRFRAGKGRQFVELDDHDLATTTDPESELIADEVELRLRRGLETLPRLQREVFLLRVQQGLDYTEIAVALVTTPGSARVHYHHAVKRLKELLK